ncbi:MAG: biopolymer transporter ExbD [Rickettsiales bacterium]|nr:biopolymer transporter ExbD [Rickettsiales bacterium]
MINISNLKTERSNIESDLIPDLTPLIDVMFMLIIFLILTMNVALKSFNVELAEDKDNLVQDQAVASLDLVIFNNADDWSLDGVKLSSFEELKIELQKRSGNDDDIKINILSDKSVPVEKLVRLLIFTNDQKIDSSNIVVK